jgi:hypothetical protein
MSSTNGTASDEQPQRSRDDGFEYQGTFYRWHVSDMGKDLMLIDRFSGLPVTEFFEVVDDEHERTRGPILLTLIATSIRNGRPAWSVERIVRTVMDLNLSEVDFVSADEEDEPMHPLPEHASAATAGDESLRSLSDDSSLPSTPAANRTSETLSEIPT